MAGPFKVDWFFQTAEGLQAGWTETMYVQQNTLQAALVWALSDAYINARMQLLDPGFSWTMTRVSDVLLRGDSLTQFTNPGQFLGQYPNPIRIGDSNEEPWDGLLHRMTPGGLRRRMFIMRGLPSGISETTFSYTPNATWLPLWNSWKQQIITQGLLMRTYGITTQGQPPVTLPAVTPLAVRVAADQKSLQFDLPNGQGATFGIGLAVNATGFLGAWPINKRWRIRVQNGDTITTYPGRRLIWGTPTVGAGSLQLFIYNYLPITTVDALRGAKRATGRPFALLRGRRTVPGA